MIFAGFFTLSCPFHAFPLMHIAWCRQISAPANLESPSFETSAAGCSLCCLTILYFLSRKGVLFFMETFLGLMIPFIGTTLGAACVFFLRGMLPDRLQKGLLGFASGVMIAASIWSLIIPSIEQSAHLGKLSFLPAVVGFLVGILSLLLIDRIVPQIYAQAESGNDSALSKFHKTTMLVLAVTIHNIPEGMAVGAVFAGVLAQNTPLTMAGAFALSIGIAIQNFPEGAIISLPLRGERGMSRSKAFLCGTLSGIVEPIAGLLTIALSAFMTPLLPYSLSFAAGAMMYVVAEELIPEAASDTKSNIGTIGLSLGFVLMMMLDVTLG